MSPCGPIDFTPSFQAALASSSKRCTRTTGTWDRCGRRCPGADCGRPVPGCAGCCNEVAFADCGRDFTAIHRRGACAGLVCPTAVLTDGCAPESVSAAALALTGGGSVGAEAGLISRERMGRTTTAGTSRRLDGADSGRTCPRGADAPAAAGAARADEGLLPCTRGRCVERAERGRAEVGRVGADLALEGLNVLVAAVDTVSGRVCADAGRDTTMPGANSDFSSG
mmetsp:Transcript_25982/g.66870  ORF Transcript_25982/g.66870 Transcript_25982/m.66870 type:complete len:225 (-) Transcript_25982:4093-4767(-)